MSASNDIVVDYSGQYVGVFADHDRLWMFTAIRHRASEDSGTDPVFPTFKPVFEVAESYDGSIVRRFGRGYGAVIEGLLRRHGCRVRRRGADGMPPLAPPVFANIGCCERVDRLLLEALRARERLLVRYHADRATPETVCHEIIEAWPKARVFVIVATEQHALRLYKSVGGRSAGVAMATSKYPFQPDGNLRVIVGTLGSLGLTPLDRADFVLFPAARVALHSRNEWVLDLARHARFIGFLNQDDELSPYERDMLRGIFGFEEWSLPGHGLGVPTVHAMQLRITGGPRLDGHLDGLGLKLQGIWLHAVRNRRIAALARGCRENGADLAAQFPAVARAIARISRPRVLVLVECLDHALFLARRLPGWPVLSGRHVDVDGLPREFCRSIVQGLPNGEAPPECAMATMTGAARMSLAQYDVVIRADGGQGMPELCLTSTVEALPLSGRLLLVDFRDLHHGTLQRWSRSRREAYAARRWFAPGADPATADMHRFLVERERIARRYS
jgi:hypothetical protein